jgi:hypothetical protein
VITQELDSQIRWAGAVLSECRDQLHQFEALQRTFESFWLQGDFAEALIKLTEIDELCGVSLWSIDARISILQESGLDAQKAFCAAVIEKAPRSIAGFVAYYISIRNEEATTLSRFRQRVIPAINRQRVSDVPKAYLRSLLADEPISEPQVAREFLSYASSVSVVDATMALLHVFDVVATTRDLQHLAPIVAEVAAKLDSACSAFAPYVDLFGNAPFHRDIAEHPTEDFLFLGQYEEALHSASDALARNPADVGHLWFAAAAISLSGTQMRPGSVPKPFSQCLGPLAVLHGRRGGIIQAVSELTKIFCNTRFARASRCLAGYFGKDWVDAAPVGISKGTAIFTNAEKIQLHQAIATPLAVSQRIVDAFADAKGPSAEVARSQASCQTPNVQGAVEGQLLEALAVAQLAHDNGAAALNTAREIRAAGAEPWTRRAAGLIVTALLDSEDTAAALDQIVDFTAVEDDLRQTLPLRRLFDGRRWRDLSAHRASISLPIALELHQRTTGDREHQSTLRTSYDEFLKSQGVDRPSNLNPANVDVGKLRQFWERVCVPEIMDVSFRTFSNSRELTDERIRVCALLSDLAPEETERYQEEIRELTKAQKLQDALRDVDRSRVHVNTDGIRRVAVRDIGESFSRYKELLGQGRRFAEPGYLENILKQFEEGGVEAAAPLLVNPNGEGDELLVEMVDTVEREYLSNSDHGLDAYLSMRVRHGSLAGHIRGPLQSAELVTARKADGASYAENPRWKAEFSTLTAKEQETVQGILAAFSAQIDRLLDDLIKNKLQIWGPMRPEGAFALRTTPLFLHYVRSTIAPEMAAEDFVDVVVVTIELRLSRVLAEVQQLVSVDLKMAVGEAVETLRADLEGVLPLNLFTRINGVIAHCMTEVQAAVDRVSEWFSAPREAMGEAIATADWLVELAVAATKSANVGFAPVITKRLNTKIHFTKGAVSEFLDMLFIILGNVAQHSGLGANPEVSIEIATDPSRGADACVIRVESAVAEGAINAESTARLDRIRQIIAAGNYRQQVNREGGTGLLKLQRMIALNERRSLEFGFGAGNTFFTEIRTVGLMIETDSEILQ